MITHEATVEKPQIRLQVPPSPEALISLRITVDSSAHGPSGERRFTPVLWVDDDTGERLCALDFNNKRNQLLLHMDPKRDAVARAPRGFWVDGKSYRVDINIDRDSVSIEIRREDGRLALLEADRGSHAWPAELVLSLDRALDHGGYVPAIGYEYEVLAGVVGIGGDVGEPREPEEPEERPGPVVEHAAARVVAHRLVDVIFDSIEGRS